MQCSNDSQCSKYSYCSRDYRCIPKLPENSGCAYGIQCLSGNCKRPLGILPFGTCAPSSAADNDPIGKRCTSPEQCNGHMHVEQFYYCADLTLIGQTASGIGLPFDSSLAGSDQQDGEDRSVIYMVNGQILERQSFGTGACVRLALIGDRCDVDGQCLSGFCSDSTVCDLRPAPTEADNGLLFIGDGTNYAINRRQLLIFSGALSVVLILLSVAYLLILATKRRWLSKRLSQHNVTASSTYVPMHSVAALSRSRLDEQITGDRVIDMPPPPPYEAIDLSDFDDEDSGLSSSDDENEKYLETENRFTTAGPSSERTKDGNSKKVDM